MKLSASKILVSMMLLALSGCGIVETFVEAFQEMSNQTEEVCTAIEHEIGSRPMIGWQIQNGVLSEVNVYFDNLADENITLAEIKEVVKDSIDNCMEKQPKKLLITINVTD